MSVSDMDFGESRWESCGVGITKESISFLSLCCCQRLCFAQWLAHRNAGSKVSRRIYNVLVGSKDLKFVYSAKVYTVKSLKPSLGINLFVARGFQVGVFLRQVFTTCN